MFCSNCGKTIRPDDKECRHCGAFLGEDRFYGSTYTSSQVRVPVEALNQAPEGGMISYTRTNYMSFDNQPADDVYSNTTYRPLLSDEEDLELQEAEEEAARQAEQAAEAQAAEEDEFAEAEPAEEAPAKEEEAPADDFEEAFEEEAPAEDVPEPEETEQEEEYRPLTQEELDREYPLDPLKKAAISPRVLSYMEELDRRQQRRTENAGGLRMPSFLKRKIVPVQEEIYEEELPEAEDIVASEADSYDYSEAQPDGEAVYEEAVYDESVSEDAASGETAFEAADFAENDFSGELTAEEEEIGAEEYVADAEGDGFEHYEDEEYADAEGEEARLGFDFAALLENAKSILQNHTLKIAAAAALIVAVIAAGIFWLNFVTAKRPKIAEVTYSAYTQGIELLNTRIGEEYRDTMQQVYLTNTSYANESFSQDMAALDALMPETPLANDELFITTLTIIQDAIADAIKADADAVLNGTEAAHAANSELAWQAIGNAVAQLSEATNPGELSVLVIALEDIVAPSPTPSPTPTAPSYTTLTNGMMDSVPVRQMQNRLINLGYLEPGNDDGDFGNGTEAAVKAFQRAADLTADGIASPEVQIAMFADDAPRTGTALLNATETPAPGGDEAAPQNPAE